MVVEPTHKVHEKFKLGGFFALEPAFYGRVEHLSATVTSVSSYGRFE